MILPVPDLWYTSCKKLFKIVYPIPHMQWSVHNRVHLPPSDLECGTCFLQHVSIQGYFSMITCRSIFIGCLAKQIILSSPVQQLWRPHLHTSVVYPFRTLFSLSQCQLFSAKLLEGWRTLYLVLVLYIYLLQYTLVVIKWIYVVMDISASCQCSLSILRKMCPHVLLLFP